mgnify:CR=1 FL=1
MLSLVGLRLDATARAIAPAAWISADGTTWEPVESSAALAWWPVTSSSPTADAAMRGAQDYVVKDRDGVKVLSRALHYAVERKRADAKLEQYRTLFRVHHEPMLMADWRGALVRVNPAQCSADQRAVLDDSTWETHGVCDGKVVDTYQAREVMRLIAEGTQDTLLSQPPQRTPNKWPSAHLAAHHSGA